MDTPVKESAPEQHTTAIFVGNLNGFSSGICWFPREKSRGAHTRVIGRSMMLNSSIWSGLLGGREVSAVYPALNYPLPETERIAVVGAQLRAERRVRSYLHWQTRDLEAWRPQALAGHRTELFAIGELRRRQFVPLLDLMFPLVVLSSLREGPLSDEQHDRLWTLYGLPVYEQIRGADETLLGWECDAREGWHLALDAIGDPALTEDRVRAAGWRGDEIHDRCACGETCPRLVVEVRQSALSMAAGAD